jgi:hypothetical protein
MLSARSIPIFTSLWLIACGASQGPKDPDDEALLAEQGAATVSWTAPSCDEDGLSSPSGSGGSCDGPYLYSRDPNCTEAHPSCGPEMIKSCAHWANGISYKPSYTKTVTREVGCSEVCEFNSAGEDNCSSSCGSFSPVNPNTWCAGQAATSEATLESSVDPAFFTASQLAAMRAAVVVTPGGVSSAETEPKLVIKNRKRVVWQWKLVETCPLTVQNHPQKVVAPNKTYCGSDGFPVCDHCPRVDGLVSAPGATFAQLGADIVASECLTCDHAPLAGKADCLIGKLDASVPAGLDVANFRSALIARLKLLAELHPETLSATQRERALELYAADPAAPSCAAPLPDVPGCSAALNGLLEACHALTLPHVSGSIAAAELGHCLAGFALAAAEANLSCRGAGTDAVADVVEVLVDKAFSEQITLAPNGTPAGLTTALNVVDAWYEAAAPAALDPTWLRRRTGAIVADFWRRAYGVTLQLPASVSATTVDAVLADLAGTGKTVDYAVLTAAFSPATAIDSPPLLMITGDALVATIQKLRFVSVAHDLACQYQTCLATGADDITLQGWRIMSALPDAAALTAALAASPQLQTRHPALFAALAAVRDQHARLAAAWTASGVAAPLSAMLDTATPPWATALRSIVGEARVRWTQAQATGTTTGREHRVLHAGVQQEAEIRNLLTQREAALTHALEEYQDSKVILVNAVLQQMQGAQTEEAIRHEMITIGEQLALLLGDLLGARGREAAEEGRYADVAAAFMHLLDVGVFDADVSAATDVQPPLVVSGRSARYTGTGPLIPAAIATRSIPMTRGQSLRFSASGEWAPSCALQRARLPGPTGGHHGVSNADALIGPEGYRLQWTGTDYSAHSFGYGWSLEAELSVKACLHAETGFTIFGNGAKATVDACAGLAYSTSVTDNNTSGTDKRTSASFSGGLRLPETPFPLAPAGALLIVATEPQSAVIVDVQVMQRQGVYVAPDNVDVHVIVNDVTQPQCVVRDAALTVEMAKVTTLGAVGSALSQAMAATLGGIAAESGEILAQGTLLGTEAAALRSMAWTNLAQNLGMPIDGLPSGVTSFFGAWLDKELASLERRAYISSLSRQIDAQLLRLTQLDQELGAAIAQSRLMTLIPRWRARNLADQEITPELDSLLAILESYAPPVFELRYPDERAALLASAGPQLAALRGMSLDGDAEDVIGAVLALSQRVRWALETASVDLSTEGLTQVALVFPRPLSTAAGCEDFGTCLQTVWRTASHLIDPWAGLAPDSRVTLHVTPEDLYSAHGGVAQLDCDDHAPVIHRMGLYLTFTDDTDLAPYNLRLPVIAGRAQKFPTAAGVLDYDTARQSTSLSVRVTSGLDQNALIRLPATETVGQGLSPFGDFTVDLTALPVEHKSAASAVVLVLELERHRPGPDVILPGVCQPLP